MNLRRVLLFGDVINDFGVALLSIKSLAVVVLPSSLEVFTRRRCLFLFFK